MAKHKHKWRPWAIIWVQVSTLTAWSWCKCGERRYLTDKQVERILNAQGKWRYRKVSSAYTRARLISEGEQFYIRERRP